MQHLIKSELRRRKEAKHNKSLGQILANRMWREIIVHFRTRPILQDEIEYPNENQLFCFELKNRK